MNMYCLDNKEVIPENTTAAFMGAESKGRCKYSVRYMIKLGFIYSPVATHMHSVSHHYFVRSVFSYGFVITCICGTNLAWLPE